MNIVKSYKDLCNEIEIWELRVETYKAQAEAIQRMGKLYGPAEVSGIDYSQPNVQSSGQISFETALHELRQIDNHIDIHNNAIEHMKRAKQEIDDRLSKLEGLDKKVVYMRDVEGMQLYDIANKLNYSYQYIREIYAKAM